MPSTVWDPGTLASLADAREVDITPLGADGARRAGRTIWSIGVGGGLYVRSWKGRGSAWFRDVLASGLAEVTVTGGTVGQRVTIEEVDAAASVQKEISATFLSKYAKDGYAAAMNEDTPVSATLRLLPS